MPLASMGLSVEGIEGIRGETAPYPPDSREGVEDKGKEEGKRLSEEDGMVWPMVMSVGWKE